MIRGYTKQNRAEAEAVVEEIMRRLSDESLRGDSIGVVTFSSAQQNLIEDLLEEAFDRNPRLDAMNDAAEDRFSLKIWKTFRATNGMSYSFRLDMARMRAEK